MLSVFTERLYQISCVQIQINMFRIHSDRQQPLSRPLFHTLRKQTTNIAQVECYYCSIKQKFSMGGENQKCLQHTINNSQKSGSPGSENSVTAPDLIEETLEALNQAEENLEEYWNNLRDYSGGSVDRAKQQLKPIFQAVGRIQEKLSRFPNQENYYYSSGQELKRSRDRFEQQQKKMATKSEKFITSNFSQLFQETTINEQIKQWVMYFHKILINREIREESLFMEDELDLKIFKDSMQRKFLTFAKNYDKYEKRVGQALQKLLFYMQNCSGAISQRVLKQDISFIEQCQYNRNLMSNEEEKQWMLLQALSIEQLLAQKEHYQ